MELVTLCPVAVVGPVMGTASTTSCSAAGRTHAGLPEPVHPFVDVRDVAAAHVPAMATPAAAGQRFLLSGGPAIAVQQVGALLKANLGDAARRVSTRTNPNPVVRVAALFSKEFRPIVADLGYARKLPTTRPAACWGSSRARPTRRFSPPPLRCSTRAWSRSDGVPR
ncbi:hypothetical protein [Micromonospora sp. LOL_021]|uniref:hypothetical protein n=1 Tax=Micromonospora sp. LOL_021 TaxID=3345417 RepID=UPI003A8945D7